MKHLRFQHSGKLNGDHADYLFVFNHCQFGDICSEVAMFITSALPKLASEFKKSQPKKP